MIVSLLYIVIWCVVWLGACWLLCMKGNEFAGLILSLCLGPLGLVIAMFVPLTAEAKVHEQVRIEKIKARAK